MVHSVCTVSVSRRIEEQTIELGSRIREMRLQLEMSQEDLGEASGLHRTYIGHIERGEVNPSLLNLLKLAAALGIDASELVVGLAQTIGDPRTA